MAPPHRNIMLLRTLFNRALLISLTTLACTIGANAKAEGYTYPCGQTTCTIYRVDLSREKLSLMDRDDAGSRFGNAEALEQWALKQGKLLRFATNAGIFSWTFNPLGLFIKDGKQIVPLNSEEGSGNFYMKPNGVFYIEDQVAHIVETSQYHPSGNVSLASQSGPLLLVNGQRNPLFNKESGNRTIRNGVGVKDGREAFFAISNGGINFWDFSALFRDKLGCNNALYLDGLISKMYIPELRRYQKGGYFAALFAIFEEQHNNVGATAESGPPR